MSSENVKLSIIGGMALIVGMVFLIPGKKLKINRQGSSSSSNANSIESAAKSVKESINSLASSSPIKFGKSKSSSPLKFGGSQRNRRVSKQRTKSRR